MGRIWIATLVESGDHSPSPFAAKTNCIILARRFLGTREGGFAGVHVGIGHGNHAVANDHQSVDLHEKFWMALVVDQMGHAENAAGKGGGTKPFDEEIVPEFVVDPDIFDAVDRPEPNPIEHGFGEFAFPDLEFFVVKNNIRRGGRCKKNDSFRYTLRWRYLPMPSTRPNRQSRPSPADFRWQTGCQAGSNP
jgi:hypothetical protein